MPPLRGLKTVRSKIHGYGVVTLRPFKKGELITYGDGVIWEEHEEFDDEYALILNNPKGEDHPEIYYDLADQTRWFNHSCDPTGEVDSEWDEAAQTMTTWWYALRDIEPGEEITYDYAFFAHLAVPCNCQTAKCRGVICDEDELDAVPEHLKHHVRKPPPVPASKQTASEPRN